MTGCLAAVFFVLDLLSFFILIRKLDNDDDDDDDVVAMVTVTSESARTGYKLSISSRRSIRHLCFDMTSLPTLTDDVSVGP